MAKIIKSGDDKKKMNFWLKKPAIVKNKILNLFL